MRDSRREGRANRSPLTDKKFGQLHVSGLNRTQRRFLQSKKAQRIREVLHPLGFKISPTKGFRKYNSRSSESVKTNKALGWLRKVFRRNKRK